MPPEQPFDGAMLPSARDEQYLGRLRTYYKRHKAIPTMATISGVVGLASTSSVFALVGRLTDTGFLQRTSRAAGTRVTRR